MPKSDIQKLILSEIQEIKTDMKQVRQSDIPGLHLIVATLQTELKNVKEKTSTRSTVITAVGGLLAVATSMAVAYLR